eukprot:5197596-Pyramimonas_sp.AAC.1
MDPVLVSGSFSASCGEKEMEEMVREGIRCYITQLLNTGFFHADPHPGATSKQQDKNIDLASTVL